jgi:hypothetical protein
MRYLKTVNNKLLINILKPVSEKICNSDSDKLNNLTV